LLKDFGKEGVCAESKVLRRVVRVGTYRPCASPDVVQEVRFERVEVRVDGDGTGENFLELRRGGFDFCFEV